MICTFYSYKGGVGRSMALANVAEIFYQSGRRVLMVDWDLEAPGLERFFPINLDDVLDKPGVMDMVMSYKRQMAQEFAATRKDDKLLPFEKPERFIVDVYPEQPGKGCLWLLPAGRRSNEHFAEYASAVRNFDWQDFYQDWEGELYLEWLRQEFEQIADIILIDSRTGVTEIGGVCTYQLADVVVVFCAPNQQNIDGTYEMVQAFKRPEVRELRGDRPLEALIVPARVEDRAETLSLNQFKQQFDNRFKGFWPKMLESDPGSSWELRIPYVPYYSFNEIVAVRETGESRSEDMILAFRRIRNALDHLYFSRLAYMQPEKAAHEFAWALSRLNYAKDIQEVERLALLVLANTEPLDRFPTLVAYARGLASLARDDRASAVDNFEKALGSGHQLLISGINLPIPEKIIAEVAESASRRLSSPVRRIPFIYGRPVRGEEFLDRASELRVVFSRLVNGESMVLVGNASVGKTSLLIKLTEESTRQAYLGDASRNVMFSYLSLHAVDMNFTPGAFWDDVTEPLRGLLRKREPVDLLQKAAENGYDPRSLERFFRSLGSLGIRLVLLLDEFEILLSLPKFDPTFFYLLRSLSTGTGGLALVVASRMGIAEMNTLRKSLSGGGSPFFNNMIEVRLRPFDDRAIADLFMQAGGSLSATDQNFIRRLAGRQPFLLQAMAAVLLAEPVGDQRYERAAMVFYEQVAHHFTDIWQGLEDLARTTMVLLSLVELGGRVFSEDFVYHEIEGFHALGSELRRLAELGLAELIRSDWGLDKQYFLLWRGERWTVSSQAFAWWVCDNVIATNRKDPALDKWLEDQRYRGLLSQSQWDKLVNTLRSAPDWVTGGVGRLARALFDEVSTRKPPA